MFLFEKNCYPCYLEASEKVAVHKMLLNEFAWILLDKMTMQICTLLLYKTKQKKQWSVTVKEVINLILLSNEM